MEGAVKESFTEEMMSGLSEDSSDLLLLDLAICKSIKHKYVGETSSIYTTLVTL